MRALFWVALIASLLLLGCLQLRQDAPAAQPVSQPKAPLPAPRPQPQPVQPIVENAPAGQPFEPDKPFILSDNPLGEGFGLPASGMAAAYVKLCEKDADCRTLNTACELFACQQGECKVSVKAC